ncbi:hypothetical protein [Enterovibrio norvegicus]|uniref:hypothetical protein n=1 Tax=Enterovibrio norvegicus TaxID=188144 RepID=UPI0002ECE0F8|nr:hypothetical protein [Enterovibrio norvegicus]
MNNIKPQDNQSNMPNANKGSSGVNKQYSQVHGNRGKQIAENMRKNEKCRESAS